MAQSYVRRSLALSPGQLGSLRAAVNARRGVTLRIGTDTAGTTPTPLLLTKTQVAHLDKARRQGHGAELSLSKAQIAAISKDGGIFSLLAAIPGLIAAAASAAAPAITAAAPAALAALGTGALSGAAGHGVRKALETARGEGLRLGPPRRGGGLQSAKRRNKKNPRR